MTRAAFWSLAWLVGLSGLGCHKDPPPPVDAGATTPDAHAEAATAAVPPAVGPSRCKIAGPALALGAPTDADLEVGDAVAGAAGLAVGFVHRAASGRFAAAALLPPDASSLRVVDLGPTLGDAPPARLVSRGEGWLAAAYGLETAARVDASAPRELVIYAIAAASGATPLGAVPQQRDDSFAFDLVPGLVAWDEAATSGAPRSLVRVAELASDGHAAAPRDGSPPESDADSPRLVVFGAGYLLFWIAHRPETTVPFEAGSAVEVTGESPSFGWVEVVALDAHGAVAGPVRKLTPATGHVSVFDVAMTVPPPGSRPDALVVARDDGEAIDGSGGALLRVRVREATQESPVGFPGDGLGRGAPSFVTGAPSWLSWVALREETRLLTLDGAGLPAGPPTAEPELDDGRALALLPVAAPAGGAARRLLAAASGETGGVLHVLECN